MKKILWYQEQTQNNNKIDMLKSNYLLLMSFAFLFAAQYQNAFGIIENNNANINLDSLDRNYPKVDFNISFRDSTIFNSCLQNLTNHKKRQEIKTLRLYNMKKGDSLPDIVFTLDSLTNLVFIHCYVDKDINLKTIERVYMDKSNLDLIKLGFLSNITILSAESSYITGLKLLTNCERLKSVYMYDCRIDCLPGISKLSNLYRFEIIEHNGELIDLSSFSVESKSLKYLTLHCQELNFRGFVNYPNGLQSLKNAIIFIYHPNLTKGDLQLLKEYGNIGVAMWLNTE